MRRKNQAEKRAQLAAAARTVLVERGAAAIRVKDVAERAGVSPSSLLYYYPAFEELLFEVARDAIERYSEERSEAVRHREDPVEGLRLAIRLGVPDGPEDEQSRILYELDALTGTSPPFAVLSAAFFDRQAAMYEALLMRGSAAGEFDLRRPPIDLARSIVALEDGLGLQVVLGHPAIDREGAERMLLQFAGLATGTDLEPIERSVR
jgi:AcrR family transcriptional regulator